MKKCTKCEIEKNESDFYKSKTSKDGLYSWCKGCLKEYQKEYKKTDKYKKQQEEYEKTNKRKENKIKYKKTDEYREYIKKYQKTDKFKEYLREWKKKERDINAKYKLDDNMSGAIWKALKGKKAGRKWEELVGYTVEDLIKHLESKFESWMNWNNYGIYEEGKFKWHIDHIKPKSLFNYSGPENEDFKECWALENLQPLEAMENMKKSNKFPY